MFFHHSRFLFKITGNVLQQPPLAAIMCTDTNRFVGMRNLDIKKKSLEWDNFLWVGKLILRTPIF